MSESEFFPRFVEPRLHEALADSPVVLIHGPRQCGKTTLTMHYGQSQGYSYISFDDDVQRAAAQVDPIGFVADLPDKVILDEVQRVPELFTSLKSSVDSARRPGRFLLTGSANVLVVPKLADSLAGRMEILRLYPLAQAEISAQENAFMQTVFTADFRERTYARQAIALAEMIAAGGYPAALARSKPKRQAAWYRDYIATQLQRDVKDLARITALDALPRLMSLAAGQTARLLNVVDLSSPFQLSRPTIRDYLTLLEHVFLVEELPPWHSNRISRLIKSPKLHLCDTGVSSALLGVDAATLWSDRELLGQLLETFVYQELRKIASWQDEQTRFSHFRNKDGVEVDIVMEKGQQVAGIEVKAAATVTKADFKGLRKLAEATGKQFSAGIVLYDGDRVARFGDKYFAVPINALWA